MSIHHRAGYIVLAALIALTLGTGVAFYVAMSIKKPECLDQAKLHEIAILKNNVVRIQTDFQGPITAIASPLHTTMKIQIQDSNVFVSLLDAEQPVLVHLIGSSMQPDGAEERRTFSLQLKPMSNGAGIISLKTSCR